MFEMILSPRKAKRAPWEMFFVGIFYASLAILLVQWIFSQDAVLSKYSGILVVTFTVMFCTPFMYFLIRNEEDEDIRQEGATRLLKEHSKAIFALMWLFIGFIVAFSFWYIMLGSSTNFKAQIETYCSINKPNNFDACVQEHGVKSAGKATGLVTSTDKFLMIFVNNVYVLIFTIVFSLIFGAGAIFVLAWNASVIAAAVGIFSRNDVANLPLGISRYMIHGIPEIIAYFVAFLAGGILGMAITKHDTHKERFWNILQDSLNLVIIAVVILLLAAVIEVYVTPVLF
ncbi:MAG: stage II sporulation protein M [Nanoarchaeota archaeon]|nr:stage II sporulation protein M [Nanoarchaeota archaeon]